MATVEEMRTTKFGPKVKGHQLPKVPSLQLWKRMTEAQKQIFRTRYEDNGLNLDDIIKRHSDGCKDIEVKVKWGTVVKE